ncbi:helix-turn-helix domain-containing protein [Halobiforma nitratireducens]|uniref:DNA binding protein n=1 Tax=Halobiforma nitratireducens JCM 10879 TaxID=1227454 RepID=M0L4I8_9EURY|nr:helix-turn-helix domain-containing protein [Halobiforma nitratireducens]EMA27354.1 DNA binding protein [Halobiforma nitratireducens JCM 10879]
MATDVPSAASETGGTPLEATLVVEPPDCPVAREAPNAAAVSQTLSCSRHGCRTCHAEIAVDPDDARTVHTSTDIDADCICPAIATFGCVFSLESIRDGALVVSVVVRDRGLITDIVAAIREAGGSVRLERITDHEMTDGTGSVEAVDITNKQREAIELAVEMGYYDQPRRTDLGELADRLGVSRSAVSQRLNAAESKLLRSLIGP